MDKLSELDALVRREEDRRRKRPAREMLSSELQQVVEETEEEIRKVFGSHRGKTHTRRVNVKLTNNA